MAQIKITWKAFNQVARPGTAGITSATFEVNNFKNDISNNDILDAIYTATNLKIELEEFGYGKSYVELWNTIEAVAPANRTHTSLSIGDEIQINRSAASIELQDGPIYRVAPIGFEMVGA